RLYVEREKTMTRILNNVNNESRKNILVVLFALAVFISLIIFLPDTFTYSARMMTAIVCLAVIFWATEPLPLGLTALLVLLLILIFKVVDISIAFSGFASPAIHLIVGGMMLARSVNETNLMKRVT